MKVKHKMAIMILAGGFFCVRGMAQGTLPSDPDNGVPLDGGLSIAIVAGVGYGAKRLMKKKTTEAPYAAENLHTGE